MANALMRRGTRRGCALGVIMLGAALSGCGGIDGIEFNSKILDTVGLSPDSFKKTEAKTQARAPLVLPPDASRLPEPGAPPSVVPAALAANDTAWPQDPDRKRLTDADAKKADREKHCKEGNWKEKAYKDDTAQAESAASGNGCGNTLFGAITEAIVGK